MNVMAQAHKNTKANIAARISFPGAPSYKSLFGYYLAVAHAEFKAAQAVEKKAAKVMITAQDVKQGDTLVTLFSGKHSVTGVHTADDGTTCITLAGHSPCLFYKSEIVTVSRAA